MSTEANIRARLNTIGIKIGQRAANEMPHGEQVYDCATCLDAAIVYVPVTDKRIGYTTLEVRPCFDCSAGLAKHGLPGKACNWADKAAGQCGFCGASPGDSVPANWRYTGPAGMSYADAAEWRTVRHAQKGAS